MHRRHGAARTLTLRQHASTPTMMTFDLFHTPADDGSYELSINESPPLHFTTPGAALGYAVRLANQRHQQGLDYAINIEGGDGRWRLFEGWKLCA